MLGLLTRTRTSLIGVDIGTCSLRAAQLTHAGDGWRIHHWVNLPTEPTSPEPPKVDRQAEMQLAFGPGTFTGHRSALVLSPPHIEYKLLDVPAVLLDKPSAELRNALQFELDRQLPWPVAESELAAWSIKPDAKGKTGAMVVSARSASVEHQLGILERQQLECVRADIVPNALIALLGATLPSPETEPLWGVLDIGFHSARLYLMHAGRPVYARVLHGGGREVTQTLAEALRIDFCLAEQYKRIYGIRKSDRGFRSVVGGPAQISENELPDVLFGILRPTLEAMTKEIERSCRFALGQLPGVPTGPLYLIGGGAQLRGLTEALSGALGIPVLLPDAASALPAARARDGEAEHPACASAQFPALAACIGLAMMEDDA